MGLFFRYILQSQLPKRDPCLLVLFGREKTFDINYYGRSVRITQSTKTVKRKLSEDFTVLDSEDNCIVWTTFIYIFDQSQTVLMLNVRNVGMWIKGQWYNPVTNQLIMDVNYARISYIGNVLLKRQTQNKNSSSFHLST